MENLYDIINNTSYTYDESITVLHLFEQQAKNYPNLKALCWQNKYMTYKEFLIKVNKLSNFLRKLKIQNSVIGILMDRSFDMMISIYGVLKSGNTYMPISREYPAHRMQYVIEDSKASLVIVDKISSGQYSKLETNVTALDITCEDIWEESEECNTYCNPKDIAYIIYTSGTTGNPKGVMVEHMSLVNRINWMQCTYPLTSEDVLFQKTSIAFDVSVWELFWWSMIGASLCILKHGQEKFPMAIVEEIQKNNVSIIHFCPSLLYSFLNYIENTMNEKAVKSLRQVICSGEELLNLHVEKFKNILYLNNNTQLANLYGPTEATIDVTYYNSDFSSIPDKLPIGKPIHNTRVYVIGRENELKSIGEEGELCLAGVCLARGYLNNIELTDKKFVYSEELNERYYKTGDLVKINEELDIVYLGRIDEQVKIRGYRIELGEIETTINKYRDVQECCTIHKKVGDLNYLVAFIVSKNSIDERKLREFLHQYLPNYCIPNKYVSIENLPYNTSGKIDKKVLSSMIGS